MPTSGTDTDNLDALRREVARLTAENEVLRSAATGGRPARTRVRGALSAVLIVVASLLVPVGVVGVWLRSALTDTDRYVETVAPLVRDSSIQEAAATRVTRALIDSVDVETRVADALPSHAAVLAAPLTAGIENLVRDVVNRVVSSEQFAGLWDEANRLAHEQVVAVLRNSGGEAGVVRIDLTEVVAAAADRLAALGLQFFDSASDTPVTFSLVESAGVARLQATFAVFDRWAPVLPWVVILPYAAAVAVSTKRRRAMVLSGLGVVAGALLLLVALAIGRSAYLGALPVGSSVPANEMIFDTLTRFLRGGGRTVLAIGLVMAIAASLSGPGALATSLRWRVADLLDLAGSAAVRKSSLIARAGSIVARHRVAFRIGIALAAVGVLLTLDRPSGGDVLWLGVLSAAGLLVVEFLDRAGAAAGDVAQV